jgi:CRP/FNR family transcriptional regulator, anaerobic regulatory protein
MFSSFLNILNSIVPLSQDVHNHIITVLKKKEIKAGETLVKCDEINNTLYFIEKGLVRGFYYKIENEECQEVTSWIVNENNFIYVPHSFILKIPSLETVEALEDSIVISLKYDDLHYYFTKYPETNTIGRVLTELYLLIYDERIRSLRMMTAQQRYEKFKNQYPEIYKRAPNKYIASFLGVSPETFSRIRTNYYSNSKKNKSN